MDYSTMIQIALPLVAPMLIAGLKYLAPKVPTLLLPFVGPMIGALTAALTNAAGGDIPMMNGLALGLAGSGVREAVDQGTLAYHTGKPMAANYHGKKRHRRE